VNEFNSHLEALSEHHDIPKVCWHDAVWLEAVPDESVCRLVLVKMLRMSEVGNGKGVLWVGLWGIWGSLVWCIPYRSVL